MGEHASSGSRPGLAPRAGKLQRRQRRGRHRQITTGQFLHQILQRGVVTDQRHRPPGVGEGSHHPQQRLGGEGVEILLEQYGGRLGKFGRDQVPGGASAVCRRYQRPVQDQAAVSQPLPGQRGLSAPTPSQGPVPVGLVAGPIRLRMPNHHENLGCHAPTLAGAWPYDQGRTARVRAELSAQRGRSAHG